MDSNKGNVLVGIIMAMLAIFTIGWKVERAVLDRKILRNRAKRSTWLTWR